jgi:hypothetical protein
MSDDLGRLRDENRRLRELLTRHGIKIPPDPPVLVETVETRRLSPEAKIRLFRELFRGRDDVYAVRWESPDGRKGYSPKSDRDWKAWYAARPEERQKVDCETRKHVPLTDEVIRAHLQGEVTVGVYPLLRDESCWLLAADFDKTTWQEDCRAFLESCSEWNIPAALERSRSGRGGHVWIFFENVISAFLARKLGCALLTRAMERRHQIGLDSYDRLFPNQDTMPKGGFGNLIALPLQKIPREAGNSVFLDSRFEPWSDQWAFLASVKRISASAVEAVVAEVLRKGDLIGVRTATTDDEDEPDPWTLPPSRKGGSSHRIPGPFPTAVDIIRSNLIYVDKAGLPPAMLNRLLRIAAFQNPEFYKAQSMRLSTYGKPRVIFCGEDVSGYIALPRGCLADLTAVLESHSIKPNVRDERYSGPAVNLDFHGTLRDKQTQAVQAIIAHDEGIVCAPTAFGKTAVAAWLIANRNVSTLILVHRQQLLDQWRERLAMFLELPIDQIGHIGGGSTKRSGRLDVAVIQSLYHDHVVKDLVSEYGHVVVDECHHLSAVTFEKVLREVKAKYVVGLTATPARKDGHHPIIYMQCGPIRYRISARTMTESTPFEHIVIPRTTDFRMSEDIDGITIQDVYSGLVGSDARNQLIAADLTRAVLSGRSPLLLTGRTEHLAVFAEKLTGLVKNILILKGGLGRKQRRALAKQLASIRKQSSASYSPRAVTSAKALTTHDSTRCSSPCPSPGRAPCSSTLVACTDFMTQNAQSRYTTTSTPMFGCWFGCTTAG